MNPEHSRFESRFRTSLCIMLPHYKPQHARSDLGVFLYSPYGPRVLSLCCRHGWWDDSSRYGLWNGGNAICETSSAFMAQSRTCQPVFCERGTTASSVRWKSRGKMTSWTLSIVYAGLYVPQWRLLQTIQFHVQRVPHARDETTSRAPKSHRRRSSSSARSHILQLHPTNDNNDNHHPTNDCNHQTLAASTGSFCTTPNKSHLIRPCFLLGSLQHTPSGEQQSCGGGIQIELPPCQCHHHNGHQPVRLFLGGNTIILWTTRNSLEVCSGNGRSLHGGGGLAQCHWIAK